MGRGSRRGRIRLGKGRWGIRTERKNRIYTMTPQRILLRQRSTWAISREKAKYKWAKSERRRARKRSTNTSAAYKKKRIKMTLTISKKLSRPSARIQTPSESPSTSSEMTLKI